MNQGVLLYYLRFVRIKPCRPRTTAYTVGCLVQDGQYITIALL